MDPVGVWGWRWHTHTHRVSVKLAALFQYPWSFWNQYGSLPDSIQNPQISRSAACAGNMIQTSSPNLRLWRMNIHPWHLDGKQALAKLGHGLLPGLLCRFFLPVINLKQVIRFRTKSGAPKNYAGGHVSAFHGPEFDQRLLEWLAPSEVLRLSWPPWPHGWLCSFTRLSSLQVSTHWS